MNFTKTSSNSNFSCLLSLFYFRYLPGIKLPENIVAVPDLLEACKDATLLIFVVPHQVKISNLRVSFIICSLFKDFVNE